MFCAAAAAALLIATSGCSSSPPAATTDPASTPASTKSSLPAAEGKTQYPLTLETPWGKTVLEERPERIVTLGAIGVELVVALGVAPVASSAIVDRAYWVQQAMPGGMDAVEVYDWGNSIDDEINYEEILESEPDLIVASGDLSESFAKLSDIAPVVGDQTLQQGPGSGSWRELLPTIGAALDLSDAAARVDEGYDNYFTQARAENPEFEGLTVTYAIQYPEKWGTTYSSSSGSPVEQFFLDLGFAPNPGAQLFAENQDVSGELVNELDADVIVVSGVAGEAETKRLLTETPLFEELPAVKSGNWAVFYNADDTGTSYTFDGKEHPGNISWAMAHGGGPIGKQWVADQLIPVLKSAVKGN